MICKFCCQKTLDSVADCLTDDGKERVLTAAEKRKRYASVFTVLSFVIEAIIILLSMSDIFGVSVFNDFFGLNDKSFGIFDILNKSFELTGLENESYWFSFVFFAVALVGIIIACAIYFFHKFSVYSFSSGSRNKIRFGTDYSVYSIGLPVALSITSAYTVLCYNSWVPDMTIYPSAALWIIFALTIVQIILNHKFNKMCAKS